MDQKIKKLVDSLILKTKEKNANWDRVGASNQFVLSLDGGKVILDKLVSKQDGLFFRLLIINNNAEVIFTLNAKRIDKPPLRVGGENDFDHLKELYEIINRIYFKVDETIEGIIGEIERIGNVGKKSKDFKL